MTIETKPISLPRSGSENKGLESAKARVQNWVAAMPKERLKTRDDYDRAGSILAEIKTFRREWGDFMAPIKRATQQAHKVACAQFAEIDRPLEDVMGRLTFFMGDFETWHARFVAEQEAEANALAAKEGFDPLVVTYPKLTAPDGLSKRVRWRAEVVNLMDLVKAVADGRAPLAYLEPNLNVLNMQARALKSELKGRVPGVEPVQETGYALNGGEE